MNAPAFASLQHQAVAELAPRYDLEHRLARAGRVLTLPVLTQDRLLRHHSQAAVYHPEIGERDNLDELLTALSLLFVGGAATHQCLSTAAIDARRITALLTNDAVMRYYEEHYPLAVPVLLREQLLGRMTDLDERLAAERATDGWKLCYIRFLALAEIFAIDSPMSDFLSLLDDYNYGEYVLRDIAAALDDPAEMAACLEDDDGRHLLEGMEDFLEFTEDFDRLLSDMEDCPLHRGMFWLSFGYWYGGGGECMREAANWLTHAIRTSDRIVEDEAALSELELVMARMTDFGHYPAEIIAACAVPLARWRRHAIGP